jgi:hypothetical protein
MRADVGGLGHSSAAQVKHLAGHRSCMALDDDTVCEGRPGHADPRIFGES